MFDFFDSLIGYIEVVFEYISTIIGSLITFVTIIPQAISFPLSLIGLLPVLIGTSLLTVIGVSVIKLIIGR